jgi:hypothetical protein
MSIKQRLANLGIDSDLPEEEIARRVKALSDKYAEEEAEARSKLARGIADRKGAETSE